MKNKIIALLVTLCFITLAIPISEGTSGTSEEKTITFVKYLPNGDIERFTSNVNVEKGRTLSQAISQKCAELLNEDARIQSFIQQQLGLYLIVSGGDGLHFALPPALLSIPLLQISFNLLPSIIYCSYSGNDSSTEIIPILGGDPVSASGSHKVWVIGFVGIIGWDGVFSSYNTGFAGFTAYASVS